MAFLMARSGLCLLALAIALGAFGAHGLESMVTDERLVTWETAERYQAWLSLVLIGLGLSRLSQARWVFPLLVSGMCIFPDHCIYWCYWISRFSERSHRSVVY